MRPIVVFGILIFSRNEAVLDKFNSSNQTSFPGSPLCRDEKVEERGP